MTDEEIIAAFRRLMNTGKIDRDTLYDIYRETQGALGCYPLASACTEDVLDAAADYWSNSREELVGIADDAAASVARYWEGYLDETNSAAIEYIEEHAEEEGIELQPIASTTTTVTEL